MHFLEFVVCLFCVCGLSLNSSRGELKRAKVFYIRMRIIFYILYLISCILYLVSCILYLVSCILYLYLVSYIFILYLISCILYLISYILYLVSHILYLVSYILYFVFKSEALALTAVRPCSYASKTMVFFFSSFWQCKGTKNIDTLQIIFELYLHYCYFFQLYLGKGTQ